MPGCKDDCPYFKIKVWGFKTRGKTGCNHHGMPCSWRPKHAPLNFPANSSSEQVQCCSASSPAPAEGAGRARGAVGARQHLVHRRPPPVCRLHRFPCCVQWRGFAGSFGFLGAAPCSMGSNACFQFPRCNVSSVVSGQQLLFIAFTPPPRISKANK